MDISKEEEYSVLLFTAALKIENSGLFEAAVSSYEIALREVKKVKHHKVLEHKITGKIKLLRSIIDYRKSLLVIH